MPGSVRERHSSAHQRKSAMRAWAELQGLHGPNQGSWRNKHTFLSSGVRVFFRTESAVVLLLVFSLRMGQRTQLPCLRMTSTPRASATAWSWLPESPTTEPVSLISAVTRTHVFARVSSVFTSSSEAKARFCPSRWHQLLCGGDGPPLDL